MNINKGHLFLKPEEGMFISMAVVAMQDQLSNTSKNEQINWNPAARKQLKEMIAAGIAVKIKLQKLGLDMSPLPPFEEGDETEFLTKQS